MPRRRGKIVSENVIRQEARFLALLSNRLLTVRLIGAPANWPGIWVFRTAESPAFGLAPGFSPIDSGATWPTLTPRHLLFVKDLDRKIMRYIRSYNRKATVIKWSYKDAFNRIKTALELNETVH